MLRFHCACVVPSFVLSLRGRGQQDPNNQRKKKKAKERQKKKREKKKRNNNNWVPKETSHPIHEKETETDDASLKHPTRIYSFSSLGTYIFFVREATGSVCVNKRNTPRRDRS